MIRLLLFTPFLMLATMLGAPLLIWAGVISPLGGFGATMGSWVVGAGAGLLCGLIGAFKPDTRPLAWRALAVGVVLAGSLSVVGSRMQTIPIHDVTTDLVDPPEFTVALAHPDNEGRDLRYPHGDPETRALQRRHYPDLRSTVFCNDDIEDVWQRALAATEAMGWNVTRADAAERVIEAEATSRVFRFVDDVVVRMRGTDGGCVNVDMRSTSRVGRSDLGANAARIVEFLESLQRSAQQTA